MEIKDGKQSSLKGCKTVNKAEHQFQQGEEPD